jgi:hypothetical protein
MPDSDDYPLKPKPDITKPIRTYGLYSTVTKPKARFDLERAQDAKFPQPRRKPTTAYPGPK